MPEADQAPPGDDVATTPLDRIREAIALAQASSKAAERNPLLEEVLELVEDLERPAPAPAPASPDGALTAALARAQGAFPGIPKGHTATVQGKPGKAGYTYTYADLADVLAAVRPVLAANGLALTQQTRHRQPDGRVELVTTLRHVGGAAVTSEVLLGQEPGNPQAFGGALTYLRRYELTTLLGIAAEEDRDAQDVEPTGSSAPRVVPPAWAIPAPVEVKRNAVSVLEVLIGDREQAIRYAGTLAAQCDGAFPDVVGRWLASLPQWQEAAAEAAALAAEERAAGVAGEQDAAAEQPDEPPVDGVSPRADEVDEPTPEELAELRAQARAGAGDEEPPPAGSIDNPFEGASELDEEAIAALRELGCVCPDPSVESGRVDECPIRGHGIPF